MIKIRNQTGLTAISIVFLLIVGGFAVLVTLRLLPVYMENFNVNSHVANVNSLPNLSEMGDEEILTTLRKRLELDDVTNVNLEDHAEILREGANVSVIVTYEVRKPLLGNVDALVKFSTAKDGQKTAEK